MHDKIQLRWNGRAIAPGRSVFEFADRREQPLLNAGRRFSAHDPRVSHPAIHVDGNFHGDVRLLKTRRGRRLKSQEAFPGLKARSYCSVEEAVKLATLMFATIPAIAAFACSLQDLLKPCLPLRSSAS
jgi:hypothetical protein